MNSDNYNYESPITRIQNQLLEEMVKKEEDQFMCEVRKTIGYNIDKAELIKALNYDRDQYDKGYQDGRSAGYRQAESEKRKGCWLILPSIQPERKKGRWIDMNDHVMCSCCGATHYGADKNYCPNCGAKMERENSKSNE